MKIIKQRKHANSDQALVVDIIDGEAPGYFE